MDKRYTALIRTYNSMPLLAEVIDVLKKQSLPPDEILIVDSSREQAQINLIKGLGYKVIRYPENEDFNFSKAINIGINEISNERVLIISSHVLLNQPNLIETAWEVANFEDPAYMGFCLIPWADPEVKWKPTRVDESNFSIDLCASNSCTLLKTRLIKERPFREDVFSAEDQEWAAFYLRQKKSYFFNIVTHDLKYMNVHFNTQKLINEQIALAYFTFPKMLSIKNIIYRLIRAVIALARFRRERAKLHFVVAREFFFARFRKPTKQSKYF